MTVNIGKLLWSASARVAEHHSRRNCATAGLTRPERCTLLSSDSLSSDSHRARCKFWPIDGKIECNMSVSEDSCWQRQQPCLTAADVSAQKLRESCPPASMQPNNRKALTDAQTAIQVASWLSHANTAVAYRGRCVAQAVKQALLFSQGRV